MEKVPNEDDIHEIYPLESCYDRGVGGGGGCLIPPKKGSIVVSDDAIHSRCAVVVG